MMPSVEATLASAESLRACTTGSAPADPGVAASPGPIVFIVDDDPIVRLVAKAVLERGGFRVTQARNGAEALERLLAGETCQLLMTDLHMPELDGAALIKRLRADPRTATLPIVILTGSDPSGEPVDCVAMGADGWTAKPVDPPRLLELVRAALMPRDALL